MRPHFSILTPTLERKTLQRMIDSVEAQTFTDYEHLLAIDKYEQNVPSALRHGRRFWFYNPMQHGAVGHYARRVLSVVARGEYLFYLDDDDYLADENVLQTLSEVTSEWAIFPVLREGNWFFHDPPARCNTTLSSFIVKREYGLFPEVPDTTDEQTIYQLDADLIESLRDRFKPTVLRDRPLVVIPRPNYGKQDVEL